MRREAGLTMVEIMVSVLLVGIAAAFVFGIQVRTSQALRDQSAVSEVQQTLRAASDVIVRDLRQAGFLAKVIQIANDTNNANFFTVQGLSVGNGSTGPDTLRLQYADTSTSARILETGPSYNSAETTVDSNIGFGANDVLLAVYTEPGHDLYGWGCMLQVTKLQGTNRIQHQPGQSVWNAASNNQCDIFDGVWKNKPYMIFVRAAIRLYRIKPDDPRGILQVSPSGGNHANDWVDIAVGIVDMQVALRVYQEDGVDEDGDGNSDDDGDGDPERDWISSNNMGSWDSVRTCADGRPCTNQLLAASVTLLAKTTKEITGPMLERTPDLFEGTDAQRAWNKVGDRPGTDLPVSDTAAWPASMYAGNAVYRTYTSTVDLRNLGIGR
jgi:type II secretory pathway pseudopilin PulG